MGVAWESLGKTNQISTLTTRLKRSIVSAIATINFSGHNSKELAQPGRKRLHNDFCRKRISGIWPPVITQPCIRRQ